MLFHFHVNKFSEIAASNFYKSLMHYILSVHVLYIYNIRNIKLIVRVVADVQDDDQMYKHHLELCFNNLVS